MDAGDAIGGLIGLGIGIVVAKKVFDTLDEHHHHHEEEQSKPKKRKVKHYEEDDTWGGIF